MMKKMPTYKRVVQNKNVFRHLKEGVAYSFGFAPVRSRLLVALVSLVGASYSQLPLIFVQQILPSSNSVLKVTGIDDVGGSQFALR